MRDTCKCTAWAPLHVLSKSHLLTWCPELSAQLHVAILMDHPTMLVVRVGLPWAERLFNASTLYPFR
jgi:hypothetical protein